MLEDVEEQLQIRHGMHLSYTLAQTINAVSKIKDTIQKILGHMFYKKEIEIIQIRKAVLMKMHNEDLCPLEFVT